MDKLIELRNRVDSNEIDVKEIQREVRCLLYLQNTGLEHPIDLNKYESHIRKIDNEFERIIFTLERKNQKKAALSLIDKSIDLAKKYGT